MSQSPSASQLPNANANANANFHRRAAYASMHLRIKKMRDTLPQVTGRGSARDWVALYGSTLVRGHFLPLSILSDFSVV